MRTNRWRSAKQEGKHERMGMIVTTTNGVEGRRVTDYLGVVHGSAVMGSNLFRDFFAGIRDVVGGRVGSYETVLTDAKDAALADLVSRAASLASVSTVS